MLLRKEVIYVVLGSGLPAFGNFLAVVIALHHLDSALLGRSYALIAFFFLAIDLFNFGSARVYSLESVRKRFKNLLFLDVVSATGSTIVFSVGTLISTRYGFLARPQNTTMLFIAPCLYALSHFSLGFFRLSGGNGFVCLVSSISALSRIVVIWLLIKNYLPITYLPDLLLAVEALYGLMLLSGYLILNEPLREKSGLAFPMGNLRIGQSYRNPCLDLMKIAGHEVLSSWYSNAIFSSSKQFDVMLMSIIVGPTGAALYRGIKSVHNVAFNFGQSFALTIHSKLRRVISTVNNRRVKIIITLAISISGFFLLVLAWLAFEARLFPTNILGSSSIQITFLFAVFTGAALLFICRLISLYIFSFSRRAFLAFSSIEVFGTLLFLVLLSLQFGLVGASCGTIIGCSGALIYASIVPSTMSN
ncbi:conserved hypothetical protein [Burkholderia sp. H160]|nr:conserved hypothetical protein [Burkholderia sp. H160]